MLDYNEALDEVVESLKKDAEFCSKYTLLCRLSKCKHNCANRTHLLEDCEFWGNGDPIRYSTLEEALDEKSQLYEIFQKDCEQGSIKVVQLRDILESGLAEELVEVRKLMKENYHVKV